MDEEEEYVYFWEVDGIYDNDGDLLIWTLMSIAIISLNEAIFIHQDFINVLLEEII